jgi:hypothetical protein
VLKRLAGITETPIASATVISIALDDRIPGTDMLTTMGLGEMADLLKAEAARVREARMILLGLPPLIRPRSTLL